MKENINKKRISSNFNDEDEMIQSGKYVMNMNNNTKHQFDNDNNEKPFLDMFMDELMDEKIGKHVIDGLAKYIEIECYETQSLILDIIDYEQGSNIIQNVYDNNFASFIQDYADDLRCMRLLSPKLTLLHPNDKIKLNSEYF